MIQRALLAHATRADRTKGNAGTHDRCMRQVWISAKEHSHEGACYGLCGEFVPMTKQILMVRRADVLDVLDRARKSRPEHDGVLRVLEQMLRQLPYHYAPNPDEGGNRNIMGQSEEQFWALVEADEDGKLEKV